MPSFSHDFSVVYILVANVTKMMKFVVLHTDLLTELVSRFGGVMKNEKL